MRLDEARRILGKHGYTLLRENSHGQRRSIRAAILKCLHKNGYMAPDKLKSIFGIRPGTDQSTFAKLSREGLIRYDRSRNLWFITPEGSDMVMKWEQEYGRVPEISPALSRANDKAGRLPVMRSSSFDDDEWAGEVVDDDMDDYEEVMRDNMWG